MNGIKYQNSNKNKVFDSFCTGLFAPGLVGIAMGFLILVGVKDSPESAGFPSVEGASSKAQSTKDEESSKSGSQKESLLDLLVNDCLKYVCIQLRFRLTLSFSILFFILVL